MSKLYSLSHDEKMWIQSSLGEAFRSAARTFGDDSEVGRELGKIYRAVASADEVLLINRNQPALEPLEEIRYICLMH